MAADKTASPTPNETWNRWHGELEQSSKAKGFQQWQTRAKKIIKRYRDDRGDGDGIGDGMGGEATMGSRFNILWSNVQTLKPALFAKTPKPVVERRYLDRDDVGRTASVILGRTISYELDSGGYKAAVEKAVLDRLLPGRGVVWLRYEPKFAPIQGKTQEVAGGAGDIGAGDRADPVAASGDETLTNPDQTEMGEEVASESVPVDYVDWQDFTTSPARTWEEVWWIDRKVYMTRKEGIKRFGEKFKDVPLDWSPNKELKTAPSTNVETGDNEGQMRATVHETWCKTDRKVYWWAKMWPDDMLDERADPLRLEEFWPVPKPLFATTTNGTLIPVPDYYEYQDQAVELDDLTNRISWVEKAVKVAGCYDASIPEIQRMLDEGFENRLVPVDNMAEFMQKAGANGMGHIWLLPIKDMAAVLQELYAARDRCLQVLFQITGLSDIIRGGEAQGAAKTATEQRIKGQFASMRLNDMQAEVARFCRDTLRLMGEIISEHFDPMTLFLVSGFEEYAKEQWPPEPVTPPQPGQQVMGGNGPPPEPMPGQAVPSGQPQPMPQPVPGSMGAPMLPPDPVAIAQAKAADMFKQAVALLKNDKLRGFRIDIETDSIVEPDQQAMQQARTELLGAIAQFLPQALQAGIAEPAFKPLMGKLLLFFLRGFKASRDIEAAFEQTIDDMTKEAANPQPKPPSPEQIKAEAELKKAQLAAQQAQQDAQAKLAQTQMDAEAAQQQHAADLETMQAELQIEREKMQMQRDQMAMEEQRAQAEHARKLEEMQAQRELSIHQANLDAHMAEQSHGLELKKMEATEQADVRKGEREASAGADKQSSVRGTELKPLIEGIGKVIEGHGKTLATIADGHKELVAELKRPKKLVRGADGRAAGIQ